MALEKYSAGGSLGFDGDFSENRDFIIAYAVVLSGSLSGNNHQIIGEQESAPGNPKLRLELRRLSDGLESVFETDFQEGELEFIHPFFKAARVIDQYELTGKVLEATYFNKEGRDMNRIVQVRVNNYAILSPEERR